MWILWLALATATAALVAAVARPRWAPRVLWAATALSGVAFLVLVWRFAVSDMSYDTVRSYSRAGLPMRYKIAGAWAGREGSLLLWSTYTAGVAAWMAGRLQRRMEEPEAAQAQAPTPDPESVEAVGSSGEDDAERTTDTEHAVPPGASPRPAREAYWMQILLALAAVVFLWASLDQTPFARTPSALAGAPGRGLNPSLQNPFMLIHPPVMFLAYALTIIPAAAAIAHFFVGAGQWSRHAQGPSRVNWIFYTFAMGLGGIWAYYTLGFGGYWAWDPVEVANLLPWLALTLYLHAQAHHVRFGRYALMGPFLGLLPLILTLFSSVSTRSGLWVSVHAFTDPTNTFDPDPAARFLDILDAEPGLRFYVAAILGLFFVGLGLWAWRSGRDTGHLPRFARAWGAVLVAFGAVGIVDPDLALGVMFEAAVRIVPGQVGYGLLLLVLVASVGAALPMLGAGESGPMRLDTRRLLDGSVVVLGLGLMVLFLWHMSAVRGWSTDFYTERLVYLATPVLALLTLFMAYGLGRKAAWRRTLGVVAIAAVAGFWIGHLVALAGLVVLMAIWRVGHAAMAREHRAGYLLVAAALLNVVFWLNPPEVLSIWRPVWPAQLVFGFAAFFGLHMALRHLAGSHMGGLPYVYNALLGGFYVAPVLCLAAWLWHRPTPARSPIRVRTRLRQTSIQGIHLAVALVLLGMGLTMQGGDVDVELAPGESVTFADTTLTYAGTGLENTAGDARVTFADRIHPTFTVRGETGAAELYWEPQSASHYPLPGTLRFWDQDVYVTVTGLCVMEDCEGSQWIRAFDAAPRIPVDAQITQVQMTYHVLPGIGFVWAALFLFCGSMTQLLWAARAAEPSGKPATR